MIKNFQFPTVLYIYTSNRYMC